MKEAVKERELYLCFHNWKTPTDLGYLESTLSFQIKTSYMVGEGRWKILINLDLTLKWIEG